MRISVVIPNYNYAKFIGIAIDSVLSQSDTVDEIIVVDDGSTDNSREVIESYGDKIIAVFQENRGQAAAISNGFSRATGDIICILDSDDVFFPDKVKILKGVYATNPQAGWVFHGLKHLSPEEAQDKSLYETGSGIKLKKIDVRTRIRWGSPGYDAPATSGLTFRKDFIKSLFPLPIAESIYISDHYIKFYAIAKGPGIHIPQNLGGQIIHGNNLYTGKKMTASRAKIFVNTAYFLYRKMPELKAFCTNLVIEGLICAKIAEVSKQVEERAGEYLKELNPREFFFFKLKVALKLILNNIH